MKLRSEQFVATMVNLIKGYLPLRIKLPAWKSDEKEQTFLYLKEHSEKLSSDGSKNNAGKTLFIANVPFVGGVRTSIFLHSLFGKVGEVERVVVVRNPRGGNNEATWQEYDDLESQISNPFYKELSGVILPNEEDFYDEGKFAHIIFSSAKEMKRSLKSLQKNEEGISFGRLEIQELADQSYQAWEKMKSSIVQQNSDHGESDQSDDDSKDDTTGKKNKVRLSGLMALVERHRAQIIDRSILSAACDRIMSKFEDAESEAQSKLRQSANQADDDGFVTVSYSAAVDASDGFEKADSFGVGKRKASKRSRKKKEGMGKKELGDFYRFQTKESKKRNLEDLKQQFQEDLERVKKMKEQKLYRPF